MVKLPAFFGRKSSINLLPKDSFESSTLGVVLEWAMAAGKWAVIVTQLVVMVAFLWRFGLDRKLTNLRREMAQQVAVINSYEKLEEDFLTTQRRVNHAGKTLAKQEELSGLIAKVQSLTPTNVWYERISVTPTSLSMTANAATLAGFSQLLSALQRDPQFVGVSVASIEDGGARGAQLSFDITVTYGEVKGKK